MSNRAELQQKAIAECGLSAAAASVLTAADLIRRIAAATLQKQQVAAAASAAAAAQEKQRQDELAALERQRQDELATQSKQAKVVDDDATNKQQQQSQIVAGKFEDRYEGTDRPRRGHRTRRHHDQSPAVGPVVTATPPPESSLATPAVVLVRTSTPTNQANVPDAIAAAAKPSNVLSRTPTPTTKPAEVLVARPSTPPLPLKESVVEPPTLATAVALVVPQQVVSSSSSSSGGEYERLLRLCESIEGRRELQTYVQATLKSLTDSAAQLERQQAQHAALVSKLDDEDRHAYLTAYIQPIQKRQQSLMDTLSLIARVLRDKVSAYQQLQLDTIVTPPTSDGASSDSAYYNSSMNKKYQHLQTLLSIIQKVMTY